MHTDARNNINFPRGVTFLSTPVLRTTAIVGFFQPLCAHPRLRYTREKVSISPGQLTHAAVSLYGAHTALCTRKST